MKKWLPIFLIGLSVISSVRADEVPSGPAGPSGPTWWLPQEGVAGIEINPTEEYPANNAVTDINTQKIELNHAPSGPTRRRTIQIPSSQTSVEIPLDDITDPDAGDLLRNSYRYYGNVSFGNFDSISRLLTVQVNLAPGETAEVIVKVIDYRPEHEEAMSAGFIEIIDIEALP